MGLISRVSSRTYRNLSLSSTQTLHFVTQVEFRPKRNLFKKNHKKCKKPKTKMSNGISALELKSEDARKILSAKMHLGSNNCNYQMSQYVWKRAASGAHVFDISKMWEKITLAARDNPEDVCIVSSKD